MRRILKSCCIAFSIYSKIPVPQFIWKEEDMKYHLCFFPWVGLVIGGLLSLWMKLASCCKLSEWTTVLIATAIPLAVTGGFHVDGYMDTLDAFHSYQPRERKLEILKDSHIGAFAVIMLALYYLVYLGAFAQIPRTEAMGVFCMGFYLSRILSGIGVVSLPCAKKEGLLFQFASTAHEAIVKICLYLQLAVCVAGMVWISWKTAVFVIAAGAAAYVYYGYRTKKELGGITGDTAGYFVTIAECAMAIAAAVGGFI